MEEGISTKPPASKKPYTLGQDEKILEALKAGASTAQEISFETGIDYMKVMEWFGYGDNNKDADRLSQEKLWGAKKKVMSDEADPKWLLTHHKKTKKDWSDRVEHDIDGELKLKDLTDEELKERAAEIIGDVMSK